MLNYNFEKMTAFKWFVLENFPFIEADFDALTDWQLFCKLGKEMNKLIDSMNSAGMQVEKLTEAFNQLEEYVNNYFDNTDFQGMVNNKINEMVEDGTLAKIINEDLLADINNSIEELNYIATKTIKTYNNITELKNDSKLTNNEIVQTLGFFNSFDKGKAFYKITNEELEANESNIIALNNGLFAQLILNSNMNSKQFGCVGDGVVNDTEKLQNAFNVLVENYKSGFNFEIIGNLLVNNGIHVYDETNETKNIKIFGKNSSINYGSVNNFDNGLTFISNQYTKTEALFIENISSCTINNIFIKTNENIEDGGLPLNGLYGIRFKNSPYYEVSNCNIENFFIGLYIVTSSNDTIGSGLGKIYKNNLSFNNVGIWLSNIGDTIIEDNFINSSGWNVYEDNYINIKERYQYLNSLGMLHGTAIYYVFGGNTNIRGGKIEYCLKGIYCERTNNININNINFDACIQFAIAINNRATWIKNSINITNCNFVSCGSNQYGGYNASLNGCAIGLYRSNWINIGNNTFEGGNLNYIKGFTSGTDKFFGPKISFIRPTFSKKINVCNNTFNTNSFTIRPTKSIINYSNNSSIQNDMIYDLVDSVISTPFAYRQIVSLNSNNNTLTFGTFNPGDKLIKRTQTNNGFICSEGGTLGTVENCTATVVNEEKQIGNITIPGGNICLEFNVFDGDNIGEGDYINIAGVTGAKIIREIIYLTAQDKYYAKLDTACDNAVQNAEITKKAPVFTEF